MTEFKAASLAANVQAWKDIQAPSFQIDNRTFPAHYKQFIYQELNTLVQTGVLSEVHNRPACVS